MNIFELLLAENLKVLWESLELEPYIGEAFFPNDSQMGLEFSFIKGRDDVPVALVSAQFDTNVLYRDRMGIETIKGTLPFFKEAMKIDEKLRQQLLSVAEPYREKIIERIFNDNLTLLKAARVSVERMRMQLLSTGTISIVENGVNKQYDYGFDQSKQVKEITNKWTDTTKATPLKDISEAITAYKKLTKRTPKFMVMNEDLFTTYLTGNADVLKYFNSLPVPNIYPNDEEVKSFIEKKFNVKIILSNATYKAARDFNGAAVPFYPTDRFTLTSTADLGRTIYGTTPEEADLMSGVSKATSVAITSEGVAITTWNEVDPVNVNTKVSEVVLPSCENVDQLYIVKVIG